MLTRKPLFVTATPGRRRRGFFLDAMVAFAAAVALTVLYIVVVTWAQQPTCQH